jgi:hypothetical protein
MFQSGNYGDIILDPLGATLSTTERWAPHPLVCESKGTH